MMDLSNRKFRSIVSILIIVAAVYIYQSGMRVWNSYVNQQQVINDSELQKSIELLKQKYGVNINYTLGSEVFPDLFKLPPASVYAEQLSLVSESRNNLVRVIRILSHELSRYPAPILKKDLNTIYLFSKMGLYKTPYGGTAIADSIYLSIGGSIQNHSDLYIKRLFHHEMSSILFSKYKFPLKAWKQLNPEGFNYAKSKQATLKLVKDNVDLDGNESLYSQGFLDEYAMASVQDDFNLYAEAMFAQPERIKRLADKYPAVRKKLEMLRYFYLHVSPGFKTVLQKINIRPATVRAIINSQAWFSPAIQVKKILELL